MSQLNDGEIVSMMRRLKGEICRPPHISANNAAYRYCMDEGLIKFHEWPSGHYGITDKGRDFIMSAQEDL